MKKKGFFISSGPLLPHSDATSTRPGQGSHRSDYVGVDWSWLISLSRTPTFLRGKGDSAFVSYNRGRSRVCAVSRGHSPPAPLCGVGEAPPLCRGGGSLVTITYVSRARGKEQGVKSQTRPRLPMCRTVDLSIMHRAPNTVLQKFRCTQTYKAVRAHTRSRTCTCTRPSTRTRTRARTRICTCTCTHMRGYLNAHSIARVASACSGDHARCSAMSYCVL